MRKILLKQMGVLLGTLLVVCLCSCGRNTVSYIEKESAASEETESEQESEQVDKEPESEKQMIYVYVCGQVENPGVYTLLEGSRIYDVFVLAGGFTEEADTDYWNQARLLKDGEMIYVPSKEEVKDSPFEWENTGAANETDKVNINTATKEELMTLPGIGETRALAILAYRQANGPFSSLEELKQVEGIKDAVFSKMKEYIEI